jgi:hypothetical protein
MTTTYNDGDCQRRAAYTVNQGILICSAFHSDAYFSSALCVPLLRRSRLIFKLDCVPGVESILIIHYHIPRLQAVRGLAGPDKGRESRCDYVVIMLVVALTALIITWPMVPESTCLLPTLDESHGIAV